MSKYIVAGNQVIDYELLAEKSISVKIQGALGSKVTIELLGHPKPVTIEGPAAQAFTDRFISQELKRGNVIAGDADLARIREAAAATEDDAPPSRKATRKQATSSQPSQ